jgi:hypothetical protein
VTSERVSTLEHHLYGPRQRALIHVDSTWVENVHTVFGQRPIFAWTAARAGGSVVAAF